jgi:rRNA processing protein Gar1
VLHVTPSRNVVLKVETLPKIGEKVIDEKLKQIGTIFDVFGSVSKPYVSIKPSIENPTSLVDKTLYIFPSTKKGKERERRRR